MPRRLVAAVLPAVLLLSGCATIVIGRGTPLSPPTTDVGDGEVPIVGADGGPIDELARNALADLEEFWGQRFPEFYGEDFPRLEGGYFSVDPDDVDPGAYPNGVSCGANPLDVENNAFYCQSPDEPNSDSITYDRAFLADLSDQFGRFIPDLVMAHEFGHAVQARAGFPDASIAAETQADCFAGAWTRWVADGEAEHTTVRPPELDELLRGYVELRDPVGTGLNEESAHGSYFDRVSAFQEGFADGVEACRDNFDLDRVFTQREFSPDDPPGGNSDYAQTVDIVETTLPAFYESVFSETLDDTFDSPELAPFDGSAPGCAPEERDLVYCAEENLVGFDEADLTRERASAIGDFAVATAVSIPYALSARDQRDLSTDDVDALRSAVCLTGAYGLAFFADALEGVQISAGDIDEAVEFLLTYGRDPEVLPQFGLTGFELVDVFRTGFTRDVGACGLEG